MWGTIYIGPGYKANISCTKPAQKQALVVTGTVIVLYL